MISALTIGRPNEGQISRFIARQSLQPFSYEAIGATAGAMPADFSQYRGRSELGRGETCFRRAKAALDEWRQLRLGWLDVFPKGVPLKVGETVAVGARIAGVWSLNACRIVYVVDEHDPVARYGFAYGTLSDHIAAGEERFVIEWNQADDVVWFEIAVFSRPRHWLARIGYPALVYVQRRFRRESPRAMRRAIDSESD
ncbi:MAG TPA: DUF1990 domain-containing protein [Pirellulales bacterium]